MKKGKFALILQANILLISLGEGQVRILIIGTALDKNHFIKFYFIGEKKIPRFSQMSNYFHYQKSLQQYQQMKEQHQQNYKQRKLTEHTKHKAETHGQSNGGMDEMDRDVKRRKYSVDEPNDAHGKGLEVKRNERTEDMRDKNSAEHSQTRSDTVDGEAEERNVDKYRNPLERGIDSRQTNRRNGHEEIDEKLKEVRDEDNRESEEEFMEDNREDMEENMSELVDGRKASESDIDEDMDDTNRKNDLNEDNVDSHMDSDVEMNGIEKDEILNDLKREENSIEERKERDVEIKRNTEEMDGELTKESKEQRDKVCKNNNNIGDADDTGNIRMEIKREIDNDDIDVGNISHC